MPQEKSRSTTNATWTELSCPEYLVQCETDHALGRRPCARQTADGWAADHFVMMADANV